MLDPRGIVATMSIIDISRSCMTVGEEIFILGGTNIPFAIRVDFAIAFVYSANESSISESILVPSNWTLSAIERHNSTIRNVRHNHGHVFANISEYRAIGADKGVTSPHLDRSQHHRTNCCSRKAPLEDGINQ